MRSSIRREKPNLGCRTSLIKASRPASRSLKPASYQPQPTSQIKASILPWAFERAPTHKSLLVVTRPPGNSNTVKLGIHYASGFWCPLARPRAVCRATHHAMCLWGSVLACDFGVLPLLCFVSPQTLASLQKQWSLKTSLGDWRLDVLDFSRGDSNFPFTPSMTFCSDGNDSLIQE